MSALVLAVVLTGCGEGAGSAPTAAPATSSTVAAYATAGTTVSEAKVEIERAWVRPATGPTSSGQQSMASTPPGGHGQGSVMEGMLVSAAYMVIRNEGAQSDRLVRAETDVAETVELHESRMESGVMKMQPVEGIDVPAGGSVELKPGGLHIMLIGLKRELRVGDRVELVLHFEKAGDIAVEAEVRQP
ncbi:MAG: copper chaperone PCu(A)C [Chloroflexota bacterium]